MPALKALFELINVIKEGVSPAQISAGLTLGFVLGLTPGWPLHIVLVLLLILLFKVNIAMATVGAGIAAALAWLLDPALDALGAALLEMPALEGLWTVLYNNPLLLLTRFNNSVVMGSLVISLIMSLPLYAFFNLLLRRFQGVIKEKFAQSRFSLMLKGSKLYNLYRQYS